MLYRHILQRVLIAIPVMLGVTAITFFLMMATIGNYVPGLQMNNASATGNIDAMRQAMGLSRPIYVQYADWLWNFIRGNFNHSLVDHTAVSTLILQTLPNTLVLVTAATVLAVVLAIPMGTISAWKRGTWIDHVLTSVSVVGYAIPGFWLALVMILLFAVSFQSWGLPHLPVGGMYTVGNGGLGDRVEHLVMPATVLAFFYLSIWSRYTRSSLIDTLGNDYIRTARAKGMSQRRVLFVHALRNALLPLVTLVGLQLPALVSGSVVIEVIFNWPGMGLLLYTRALEYDYTVILGITTLVTAVVVLGNLLADVSYAVLDPRIRHG